MLLGLCMPLKIVALIIRVSAIWSHLTNLRPKAAVLDLKRWRKSSRKRRYKFVTFNHWLRKTISMMNFIRYIVLITNRIYWALWSYFCSKCKMTKNPNARKFIPANMNWRISKRKKIVLDYKGILKFDQFQKFLRDRIWKNHSRRKIRFLAAFCTISYSTEMHRCGFGLQLEILVRVQEFRCLDERVSYWLSAQQTSPPCLPIPRSTVFYRWATWFATSLPSSPTSWSGALHRDIYRLNIY